MRQRIYSWLVPISALILLFNNRRDQLDTFWLAFILGTLSSYALFPYFPSDPPRTVFAGQDREATDRARSYFEGYPPSSPSIGLLRDGKLVYMMQRSDIEIREAEDIATELTGAFDRFCAKTPASR